MCLFPHFTKGLKWKSLKFWIAKKKGFTFLFFQKWEESIKNSDLVQNVLLLEIVYVAEKTMQELFMAGNEQIH